MLIFILHVQFINMLKRLILIRHGESLWNFANLYTGWNDVALTPLGVTESKRVGQLLLQNDIIPKISYTSKLFRTIQTNNLILGEMNINNIDTYESWRLNERHYGQLTGHNRSTIQWKGGYFDVPPAVEIIQGLKIHNENVYSPIFGESYYMTHLRLMPIWTTIKKSIVQEEIPMVCSHKNCLKLLIKEIEQIHELDIEKIEVPNTTPIVYDFDDNMNVVDKNIL